MQPLAQRTQSLAQSEIRNMTQHCVRAGGINLSQGICDTPPPEVLRQAVSDAIEAGHNIYTRYDGTDRLRRAISDKLQRHNGLTYDPESEVVVTAGSTGSFYNVCLALFEAGDEAILLEPYYGYHLDSLTLCGVTPRFVRLEGAQFELDFRALEAVVNERTRAIVLNTPGNPSGKVFSREELKQLADFVTRHDLYVVTDEIYEYFVYDGATHISPAAIDGLHERTITMGGFSKTFSITGWRIGYLAAPLKLAQCLGFLNDIVYVCAPAPLQIAVATALETLEERFYSGLKDEYVVKRDQICSALQAAGLAPRIPAGAYYVLADVSRIPGSTSKEKVLHLLDKTGVAAVPGSAFYQGDGGATLARFCYAKTESELTEACQRLLAAPF